jgi:hypothetical protein
MLIGYARVTTDDQDSALQCDALTKAGCEKIFDEIMSGARADRPQLRAALDFARKDDVIVVWKLDRLARSLTQLIATVERLQGEGVGFKSLTETIDATSAGGRLIFHIFGALAEFEHAIIRDTHTRWPCGSEGPWSHWRSQAEPLDARPADRAEPAFRSRNSDCRNCEAVERIKANLLPTLPRWSLLAFRCFMKLRATVIPRAGKRES